MYRVSWNKITEGPNLDWFLSKKHLKWAFEGRVRINWEGEQHMWKPRGEKDQRSKFWKEDIVLEHSEKVAKRENGKYIIWTRP